MKPGDLVRLKGRNFLRHGVATLWKSSVTSGADFDDTGEMRAVDLGIILRIEERGAVGHVEIELVTSRGEVGWTWMFMLEGVV